MFKQREKQKEKKGTQIVKPKTQLKKVSRVSRDKIITNKLTKYDWDDICRSCSICGNRTSLNFEQIWILDKPYETDLKLLRGSVRVKCTLHESAKAALIKNPRRLLRK
jgi:hypothetical protein